MEPATKKINMNPLFPFMAVGSLIYAFFYTFCLYKNASGITYPFFVGGTCFFFFFYLKKSKVTAKKFSLFIVISLMLLGISTCCTDSWVLLFFNKIAILLLFFYLMLHNIYEDKRWDISKYLGSMLSVGIFALAYIYRPFSDYTAHSALQKEKASLPDKPESKMKYVFWGIIIALPLLIVVVLLLGSADAVFSNLLENIFSLEIFEHIWNNVWGIGFLLVFSFFASYCLMCRLSDKDIKEEVPDKRRFEPLLGITVTSMISVVYLIFCFIQVVYLFGGFDTLPEDYTYASYAREGFFQLVFVCLINLSLVLICVKYFRKNPVLQGILTFISLCTFIMIASSAYRMLLYIAVYHLTFLRIFVLWALLVIFLLMCGAMILIYKQDFPLVKYCVIVVSVLYIAFSFSHPDAIIARYNLDKIFVACTDETDGHLYYSLDENRDFRYLKRLSTDAAPAIFAKAAEVQINPEGENRWFDEHYWWLDDYAAEIVTESYDHGMDFPIEDYLLPDKQSPRKYNFSRQAAYKAYTKYFKTHQDFAERISGEIINY